MSKLVLLDHTRNLLHVLVTVVMDLVAHVAAELVIVVILVTQIISIKTLVFPLAMMENSQTQTPILVIIV